jgi:bifunctional UDP-N-acetylglucosamine pyrophosphorylase/glucosamine-1-phosphate N-acetyltransferase
MSALHVVILAAGKGTRMKSRRPKILHTLSGLPLIEHVLRAVDRLQAASTTLVIGPNAAGVREALATRPHLEFVVQSPQLGTAHALLQTESSLGAKRGSVLLLYADSPLLQSGTLAHLVETHRTAHAAATVLTAELNDPYGYGRIVRSDAGDLLRIVEERDASAEERTIREVNSGIYALAIGPLFAALHALSDENEAGESYLSELVAHYRQAGLRAGTLCVDGAEQLRSVNTRVDLAELSAIVRARKNRALMLAGVTLEDPAATYIDEDVAVGADTIVGPNVRLEGRTSVGERCRIHCGVRLTNASIADEVTVLDGSVIADSSVGAGASVGPFAHVRPDSVIAEAARVGNFVELKKTRLGRGSKANHLAYLGDATIGEGVNIGAGTITCNYDGEKKHPTVIEDGVFIGSDSQLIAPVRVGQGAYVAAGSSITKDVPADALAIARGRQENKPGWAAARRARRTAKHS